MIIIILPIDRPEKVFPIPRTPKNYVAFALAKNKKSWYKYSYSAVGCGIAKAC